MSSKIKTVDNSSLDTIVEIKELPKFLNKLEFLLMQKGGFVQEDLEWEWKRTLENVFYSDVLMGTDIPHSRDKQSVSYHADEPYFEVKLEEIKFMDREIKPKMECRINPENKNEMRIKTFFYHDFSPFEIIEDALLLSYPDKSKERTVRDGFSSKSLFDIALKRGKDGYKKTRLLMAPVDRFGEIVKEAKDIYNRIGEDKISKLQDMKNSCNQIIADSHFGNTINIFRENEYRTDLLEAMGRGTKYVFMDR